MADTFTETTHQSYGSRIGRSIKAVLIGLLMFLGSFALLWWNEGNLAREKAAFKEMEALVVEGDASREDSSKNGKLVHISAELKAPSPLGDPTFLNPGAFLVLERQVEMYQWTEDERSETKKNVGGSSDTVTTYTYNKEWKRGWVDSSRFKHSAGHENPQPSVAEQVFKASGTSFGALHGDDIIERLDAEERLVIDPSLLKGGSRAQLSGNYLSIAKNGGASSPEVGDLRISYHVTRPGVFSIMAVQQPGGRFAAFQASNGKEKFLVESGTKTAAILLTNARNTASLVAWVLRGVGAFLMWFGLMVILNPLAVLLSVLPPLESIGKGAIAFFSLIVALVLSSLTIIVSMIAHNPLLLAGVLAVGITLVVWWLKKKASGLSAARPVVAAAAAGVKPPPPPPMS